MAVNVALNDTNIEILLSIRKIIDKYNALFQENSKDSGIKQQCLFELSKYGFTGTYQAKEFNVAMNVLEYDRCYKIRPIGKESIEDDGSITVDDFCIRGNKCIERGFVTCVFDLKFVSCVTLERIYQKIIKLDDSNMGKEYIEKARSLGIDEPIGVDGLYVPHPFTSLCCSRRFPDTHTPEHCVGKCIKVIEPRFDIFWGMEYHFDAFDVQAELRKRMQK